MRTAIIVLILGLTATSVMSTCAANTAPPIATAMKVAATDFVTSASGTASLCSITTATGLCFAAGTADTKLQAGVTAYITELQTLAGNRDKYIIAQRGEVVKVLDSLKKINEHATKTDSISGTYAAVAKTFVGYATTIASNFSSIVANFDTYQTSRQTCMNALIKLQAAFLCNQIKDSPATGTGIDDAQITTLNTACYPYIENSVKQSAVISAAVFSAGLSKLASGIDKAVNKDASGATTDITAAFAEMNKATYSTEAGKAAVGFPTGTNGCDTTAKDCKKWIENELLTADATFKVGANDIIIGGTALPKPTFVSSRVLKSEGNERRLVSGGYNPTLADVKFAIDFAKNPGNVDNTQYAKDPNSALRNGIVACAVAALALVF